MAYIRLESDTGTWDTELSEKQAHKVAKILSKFSQPEDDSLDRIRLSTYVKDSDKDIWEKQSDGKYKLDDGSLTYGSFEELYNEYGPLRPVDKPE